MVFICSKALAIEIWMCDFFRQTPLSTFEEFPTEDSPIAKKPDEAASNLVSVSLTLCIKITILS